MIPAQYAMESNLVFTMGAEFTGTFICAVHLCNVSDVLNELRCCEHLLDVISDES
jgi:hypothetical protein